MHDKPEWLKTGVRVLYRGEEYLISGEEFAQNQHTSFFLVTIVSEKHEGDIKSVPIATLVPTDDYYAAKNGVHFS